MRRRRRARWPRLLAPMPNCSLRLACLARRCWRRRCCRCRRAYAVCEAFGFERGVSRSFREAPVFQSLFTGLIVFGMLIALIPGLPIIAVLVNLQVLNAILMPVLLIFMLRLVNNRRLMGRHTNGRVYNIIAWATTVILIGLTAMYLLTEFLSLFGVSLGG